MVRYTEQPCLPASIHLDGESSIADIACSSDVHCAWRAQQLGLLDLIGPTRCTLLYSSIALPICRFVVASGTSIQPARLMALSAPPQLTDAYVPCQAALLRPCGRILPG